MNIGSLCGPSRAPSANAPRRLAMVLSGDALSGIYYGGAQRHLADSGGGIPEDEWILEALSEDTKKVHSWFLQS